MLASQAFFVNWSVTGWQANNPTHPNGLLPKSSISPLDLRSLSNEGQTFAIHFAVYPHKAHESIAQYNTRANPKPTSNKNKPECWNAVEISRNEKNIMCISNKSDLMQFESLWNLTWLSRYIDMTHKRHGLARPNFKALWYERGCDNRACPRNWIVKKYVCSLYSNNDQTISNNTYIYMILYISSIHPVHQSNLQLKSALYVTSPSKSIQPAWLSVGSRVCGENPKCLWRIMYK